MSEQQTNIQKFSWNEKKIFSEYKKADIFRNSLKEEGFEHVKIRRCGPEGVNFKVLIGKPVKTNKKANNKNTNKRKDT